MTGVKLEETKDRRRLHIGSYFVDLNETDYMELIRIFSEEKRVKNLSSNSVLSEVLPSTCIRNWETPYYCSEQGKCQKCS